MLSQEWSREGYVALGRKSSKCLEVFAKSALSNLFHQRGRSQVGELVKLGLGRSLLSLLELSISHECSPLSPNARFDAFLFRRITTRNPLDLPYFPYLVDTALPYASCALSSTCGKVAVSTPERSPPRKPRTPFRAGSRWEQRSTGARSAHLLRAAGDRPLDCARTVRSSVAATEELLHGGGDLLGRAAGALVGSDGQERGVRDREGPRRSPGCGRRSPCADRGAEKISNASRRLTRRCGFRHSEALYQHAGRWAGGWLKSSFFPPMLLSWR